MGVDRYPDLPLRSVTMYRRRYRREAVVRVVHSALTTAVSGLVLGLVAVGVSACGSSSEATEDPQPTIDTLAASTSSSTSPTSVTTSTLPPEEFTEASAQAAFLDAYAIHVAYLKNPADPRAVERLKGRIGGSALDELLESGRKLNEDGVEVEVPPGSFDPAIVSVELAAPEDGIVTFCVLDASLHREAESGELIHEEARSQLGEGHMSLGEGVWVLDAVYLVESWPDLDGCE